METLMILMDLTQLSSGRIPPALVKLTSATESKLLFAQLPTLRPSLAPFGERSAPTSLLDGECLLALTLKVLTSALPILRLMPPTLSTTLLSKWSPALQVDSMSECRGYQGFEYIDGARVTVNPRFNLEDDSPDVVINYNNGASNVTLTASADAQEIEINHNMGDTNIKVVASKDAQEVEIQHSVGKTDIKLVASKDAQEVTISQQIDDNNRLSPTINNDGDLSVEWERTLGDDSSLTVTLKPNESIDVEWEDGAWTANINMPLDGTSISGANVGIKRDVQF
jgi:hypothetical protein